jgi:hypothetical protein
LNRWENWQIFFSGEDYTVINMSYYNCCGIRPNTVTFQKGWGRVLLQESTFLMAAIFLKVALGE